jgi:hypothetical protein
MNLVALMRALSAGLLAAALAGCAAMAVQRMSDNLSGALLDQDDPATVKAGAPAFLLLLDGLLKDSPEDTSLLLASARLHGAYAAAFVDDPERAKRLAAKAHEYARRAMCLRYAAVCAAEEGSLDAFSAAVAKVSAGDAGLLYVYATTWVGVIQAERGWEDVADLPKVEAALERVVQLDEALEHGQAHVYLGALRSQLPPALGGDPERGRRHFERAIEISDGRNLIAKVELARRYARLVFDRPLHDRLLTEVVDADPREPGLTLSNTVAQLQARELLDGSADYFPE